MVPEVQNSIALGFEKRHTPGIILCLLQMLASIKFYD